MLVELLVHFLSVLCRHRIDLHQSCRITIGDLFRVESTGFPLSQVARRPTSCAHRVYVQV